MKQNEPLGSTGARPQADLVQVAAVAAAALAAPAVFAAGNERIRVGLVGCGGRGSGAAGNVVDAAPGVQLWAMGDLFPDRLESSRRNLSRMAENPAKRDAFQITPERCFAGFDAYKQVTDSGVDLVLLTTPPAFRPQHLRYAVEKGKHAFIEKPVAVCPAGVRSVIESARLAGEKRLAIVAGTCYRHHAGYLETVGRIHDGAIGDILSVQAYYNTGSLWNHGRKPEWSDVEWQIRNWLYFTWLSGDFIAEQHVHSLDIVNWVMRANPVKAFGIGGRQVRTGPEFGNIYDHFTTEFEYPGGVRVTSMCRQIAGCAGRVSQTVTGTKGASNPISTITLADGTRWQSQAKNNMYVQELTDMIESIRKGEPLNEGRQVAESSLVAIMGRMSAYTGKEITWEQALNSKLDLTFDTLEFGPLPVEAVAVPGKTPLV